MCYDASGSGSSWRTFTCIKAPSLMNEWMDIEVKMCVYYTIGREKEDDWLHTASEYEKLSLHICVGKVSSRKS